MEHVILAKSHLPEFISRLAAGAKVLVPAKVAGGLVGFVPADRVADAAGLLPETGNADMSLKSVVFPQTEVLMRFVSRKTEGGMVMREEPLDQGPTVVLGVRPCDAKALALLDGIFARDRASTDPYWARRRANTVLVGLACNTPGPTCFCDQMGCGPHHAEGLDALATDLGDRYLLSPLTERGRELTAGLDPASEDDLALAARLKAEAASQLGESLPMDAVEGGEVLDLCDLTLWEELAATCLNCGACTHVCPTCHCFDIQDEAKGEAGRRVRNWDSCMSRLFTQHASGHNPRGDKLSRVRQRFLHKFKYIPIKRGQVGCVGCGRCIKACPVNIDVREVLRAMNAQVLTKAKSGEEQAHA